MTLSIKPFKHLKPYTDRLSASEYNRAVDLLYNLANSLYSYGYVDSSGFITRKPPIAGAVEIASNIQHYKVLRGPEYDVYGEYVVVLESDNVEEWSSVTTYNTGDKCWHGTERTVYSSIVDDNLNHEPPDANYWAVVDPIKPKWRVDPDFSNYSGVNDFRDLVPWFSEGDIVLVSYDTDTSTYYFEETFSPAPEDGSIRWNETDKRVMAVFR